MFFRLLFQQGEYPDVFLMEFYRKVFTSCRCVDLLVEFICHPESLRELNDYCASLCLFSFKGEGQGEVS